MKTQTQKINATTCKSTCPETLSVSKSDLTWYANGNWRIMAPSNLVLGFFFPLIIRNGQTAWWLDNDSAGGDIGGEKYQYSLWIQMKW